MCISVNSLHVLIMNSYNDLEPDWDVFSLWFILAGFVAVGFVIWNNIGIGELINNLLIWISK